MKNLNSKKQNHTSHRTLHTSQKGITLIALIITIIVMLILVGVTINIALNGGLFEKAETAAKQMQIEADKEALQVEVLAVYDAKTGTIDTEKLKTNLNAMGWTVNSDGNPFICTSAKGNTFEVTVEQGNIKIEYLEEGIEEDEGEITNDFEIEITPTPNGSPVNSVTLNIVAEIPDSWKMRDFTDDDEAAKYVCEEAEFPASTLIELDIYMYNILNGKSLTNDQFTTLKTELGITTTDESEAAREAFAKLAQSASLPHNSVQEWAADMYTYNPEKTLKIGKEANDLKEITIDANWNSYENVQYEIKENGTYTIELEIDGKISTKTIEVDQIEVYTNEEVLEKLGITNYEGTYRGTWIKIGEENGKIKLVSESAVTNCILGDENNLEKSISDYKDIVSILDTAAQEATGITSVRSINLEDIETLAGIQDSDKGDNYNQPYTYNYTNHQNEIFVNESGATVKLDAKGKEVTLKHTNYYKFLSSDDIGPSLFWGDYWLASSCVDCGNGSGMAGFDVYFMNVGNINSTYLFYSNGSSYSYSNGVRAVVYI